MKIDIPEVVIRRAITALQMIAKDIAGHSQEPNLLQKEDTYEWADSLTLRRKLDAAKRAAKTPAVTPKDL